MCLGHYLSGVSLSRHTHTRREPLWRNHGQRRRGSKTNTEISSFLSQRMLESVGKQGKGAVVSGTIHVYV